MIDLRFMDLAERLADAQIGRTGGNPAVGAVVVQNGRIVGRGATADDGRPHAEALALAEARGAAKGATLYVTLEPCAHQGRTPPCAEAIIKAGIAHVICPWRDPNPLVDDQGFSLLEAAGVKLTRIERPLGDGLRYFFTNQLLRRPFVALKIATSMDGKIALQNGQSQWISSEMARVRTRSLRAQFTAIAVGANTISEDDPQLTTRINGLRDPRVVVFDGRGRTPNAARIFSHAARPLLIGENFKDFPGDEADILCANPHDLDAVMPRLLDAGIQSLLVEGGAALASSVLRARMVDRIYHVATGAVMGGDAKSAFADLGLERMEDVPRLQFSARQELGDDTLLQYDCVHFDEADLRAASRKR